MPWTSKFRPSLVLRNGRSIATLSDARALILALPESHQERPYWQYAAELLLKAADGQETIAEARNQFLRALRGEGLI
jgi:hypothetical protein